MSLTLLDIIVIAVLLISAVLAMVRGFVREVLSVASWLLAALAAYLLYEQLQGVLETYIENETLALIVSVTVIFIVVLVVVSYITIKIADFVIDSRIGGFDRIFGFLFGAARGLLLVVVGFTFFVWLVGADDQPDWVANAETNPLLTDLSERLAAILPEDLEAELVSSLRGEDPDGADDEGDAPIGNNDEEIDGSIVDGDDGGAGLDPDAIEQVIRGNEGGI